MSQVYIVVRDETDYNGERTYPLVTPSKARAQQYCKDETEREVRNTGPGLPESRWVPRFYVETSTLEEE